MAKTSISVEVARPARQVFAYMSDMAKMSTWTNMERMDLNGPLAAGTKGTFDLQIMGKRRNFPFVITAFDDGRRWAMNVTNKLQMAFDYRLTPVPGGTRIDQAIEVRPRGLLRLFGPVIVRMMRGEEMGELRRLKKALEALPAIGS